MRPIRTYLAGVGATGGLIAAAVVVFFAVAAVVAFDGPLAGSESDEPDTAYVGAGEPRPSVTALAPPRSADGPGRASAASGGAAGGGRSAPGAAQGPAGGGPPGDGTSGTDAAPGSPAPSPAPAAGSPPAAPAPASGTGPAAGAVDQVDDVAAGVGLDTGLGETTKPITDTVDGAVGDALPGANP